jgi:undecaprenyl-diphosphatase
MTLTHIALLAVVQGLTEFLPVSSSGHLLLVPLVTSEQDQGLVMDLAVHIGTLLAVLTYYRRDVWQISIACLQLHHTKDKESQRLGLLIALATIPALLFGYIMHVLLPEGIRDVHIVIATTVAFGLLMGAADYYCPHDKTIKDSTWKSALLIGLAQVLAFIPGTSRSGITMTAARGLGFKRVDAAKFSFLLSIPATAAAGAIGVLDFIKSGNEQLGIDAGLAIVFTFIAGILAITFMMKWLKNFGLMPFVVYRLFLGFGLLAYFTFS